MQLLSPPGTFDLMGESGTGLNTYIQRLNDVADTLQRRA